MATNDRRFLTADGVSLDRAGYVRYLRDCANRWRAQPAIHVSPVVVDQMKAKNEEQARRVEEQANRIERGEDD